MIIAIGTVAVVWIIVGSAWLIRAEIKAAERRGHHRGYREGQQKAAFDTALLQTQIDTLYSKPPTLR